MSRQMSAEDRIDVLRTQVARLTRERDEWEANEQEQAREVERLRGALQRVMDVGDRAADRAAVSVASKALS